jgi:hypothetical protein
MLIPGKRTAARDHSFVLGVYPYQRPALVSGSTKWMLLDQPAGHQHANRQRASPEKNERSENGREPSPD